MLSRLSQFSQKIHMAIELFAFAVRNYGTIYPKHSEKQVTINYSGRNSRHFSFQCVTDSLFSEITMDCDARRRSRIDTIKRNLSLRGCLVYYKSKPYRRIIVDNEQQFQKRTCILGSSLVFGVFIQNSVTISCPGGSISTMCSESVFTEIFERNVRQVIVMAGTNDLFDKKIND